MTVVSTNRGIRATIEITLPGANDPVELWSIAIENLSGASRRLRLVPYLEWLLNRPDADRGHTQYQRLFAEMEYVEPLHAILAWDKHSQAMGFIAADENTIRLPHRANRFSRPSAKSLVAAGTRDTGL